MSYLEMPFLEFCNFRCSSAIGVSCKSTSARLDFLRWPMTLHGATAGTQCLFFFVHVVACSRYMGTVTVAKSVMEEDASAVWTETLGEGVEGAQSSPSPPQAARKKATKTARQIRNGQICIPMHFSKPNLLVKIEREVRRGAHSRRVRGGCGAP